MILFIRSVDFLQMVLIELRIDFFLAELGFLALLIVRVWSLLQFEFSSVFDFFFFFKIGE